MRLELERCDAASVGSLGRMGGGAAASRSTVHVAQAVFLFLALCLPAPGECRARRNADTGVAGVKKQIEQIYRLHNPEKLDALPVLLEKYDGIEQELLDAVKEKYGLSSDRVADEPATSRQSAAGFDTDGRIRIIDGILSLEHQNILARAWRNAPYTWGEQDTPTTEPAGTVLELELDDAAVRTVNKALGKLGDLGLSVTNSAAGGQRWVPPEELNTWVPWCETPALSPSLSPSLSLSLSRSLSLALPLSLALSL